MRSKPDTRVLIPQKARVPPVAIWPCPRVELGIGAKIVDHVSGDILFLYEDGENIIVDEAFITINGEDVVPIYLRAGEFYVPFGNFETHMISDPLTLEIAETREAALQVGLETGGFYASAFIFNGDVDEIDADDDHVDNFGANVGLGLEKDAFNIDVGGQLYQQPDRCRRVGGPR